MVATHEDQHEAIDATLADHDSQLGLLRRNLDRQITEIRKISLIVGEHSRILTEHSAILTEHTAILGEHSESLQRIEDKLDRALGQAAG